MQRPPQSHIALQLKQFFFFFFGYSPFSSLQTLISRRFLKLNLSGRRLLIRKYPLKYRILLTLLLYLYMFGHWHQRQHYLFIEPGSDSLLW
jgi:hypothetical protein